MPSPHVTNATDDTFDAEVLASPVPVIVDFWATWCAPCKAIAPFLDQIADEKGGAVKVVKVDIDKSRKIAQRFQVSSVPTLVLVKEGREAARKVGATGGLPALRKLAET